ncbi:SDR family NAD(P)-dependent oxidoreductase [Sphingomonas sp. So64.6b]|uniref:SDR family NAD(P)-dependent oxidoreductase n=1 Tax=Sphingomonas sp. So64.6b TaxID=2997354 RepID=UPI001600D43A|nr:SDR family NAD(P)-dependent oxidoreductase [Sphingomonas sp. So64.6b]QNA83008.1 SDR family NAD(P)-dependent oxidoreductase [Sphingomonas sp. So64.6b]
MTFNTKGTALITGASSGIGRTVDVLRADLTDKADLAAVEQRLADDASITLLVNNAGMSLRGSLLDSTTDEIEQLLSVNVTAPTRLAAAAGKAFAARGTGAIINIASVLGLISEGFEGAYNGTKAHLLTVSRWLGVQLGPKGVYVQAVLPAATRTEIWERSGKDIDTFPAEVVMGVDDLVDAALVGFDRREAVTIPPLADGTLWAAYDEARIAMQPGFNNGTPAPRYREAVVA